MESDMKSDMKKPMKKLTTKEQTKKELMTCSWCKKKVDPEGHRWECAVKEPRRYLDALLWQHRPTRDED